MLSMAGICGFYFWSVAHAGLQAGNIGFGGLLETVIALVVVQVVLTAAAAIFAPGEAKAPRDKLIELRAMRVGYAALATSIALACFFGAFDPPILVTLPQLLANRTPAAQPPERVA